MGRIGALSGAGRLAAEGQGALHEGLCEALGEPPVSESDVVALSEQGWFLRDGLLGPDGALAVAGELIAFPGLRPSAMGRGSQRCRDGEMRGDLIAWLDPTTAPPGLRGLHSRFEELRQTLNREAFLGLRRFEVQMACYPGGGAGYVRHLDAFRGGPNRRLTAIWYANPEWAPDHGGALRLYLPTGPRDVEPVLDRLLVFLSEDIEHEVLPAWQPRRAVTAWFRGAAELPGIE